MTSRNFAAGSTIYWRTENKFRKKFEKKLELETFGIQTDEQDKIFITQYTNIIKKNFSNPNFGIDDICKGIGISRAQFYRKAKAQTGLSPAEMIKNYASKLLPRC